MTMHDRVRANTSAEVNRDIRRQATRRIAQLEGRPEAIRARLHELDAEWDIERALEMLASSLSLGSLALALSGGRRRLAFPAVVQGFLLLHAVQGWCPPLPLLRRLGFRSQQEIERERYTLRALLRDHVAVEHGERPAELPARSRRPITA